MEARFAEIPSLSVLIILQYWENHVKMKSTAVPLIGSAQPSHRNILSKYVTNRNLIPFIFPTQPFCYQQNFFALTRHETKKPKEVKYCWCFRYVYKFVTSIHGFQRHQSSFANKSKSKTIDSWIIMNHHEMYYLAGIDCNTNMMKT